MNIEALQVSPQQGEGRPWGGSTAGTEAPFARSADGLTPSLGAEQQNMLVSTNNVAFQSIGGRPANIPAGTGSPSSLAGANGVAATEDMEEQDAKKLRRKLNNRESARRSRQKKADEINRLQALVTQKDAELEQCRRSMSLLQMHIRTLVAKVGELGGSINEPSILQAMCAGTWESQPLANVLAGDRRVPTEATTGSVQTNLAQARQMGGEDRDHDTCPDTR